MAQHNVATSRIGDLKIYAPDKVRRLAEAASTVDGIATAGFTFAGLLAYVNANSIKAVDKELTKVQNVKAYDDRAVENARTSLPKLVLKRRQLSLLLSATQAVEAYVAAKLAPQADTAPDEAAETALHALEESIPENA
jgi:hypothetical protein